MDLDFEKLCTYFLKRNIKSMNGLDIAAFIQEFNDDYNIQIEVGFFVGMNNDQFFGKAVCEINYTNGETSEQGSFSFAV